MIETVGGIVGLHHGDGHHRQRNAQFRLIFLTAQRVALIDIVQSLSKMSDRHGIAGIVQIADAVFQAVNQYSRRFFFRTRQQKSKNA